PSARLLRWTATSPGSWECETGASRGRRQRPGLPAATARSWPTHQTSERPIGAVIGDQRCQPGKVVCGFRDVAAIAFTEVYEQFQRQEVGPRHHVPRTSVSQAPHQTLNPFEVQIENFA